MIARAGICFDCRVTSRGTAGAKSSKEASLFNGWKTGGQQAKLAPKGQSTGVGVNGCRRAKHITGGGKDEEAGRDRRFASDIFGGTGTFVKSPEPYLTPDQNRKEAL